MGSQGEGVGGELVVELGVPSLESHRPRASRDPGDHTRGRARGGEAKSHSGGPSEVSGDECRVLTDSLDLSKGVLNMQARTVNILKRDGVRSGSQSLL